MDKIWDRNPSKSEVIGRCDGDEKKRMAMQYRQKSNAKNKTKKLNPHSLVLVSSNSRVSSQSK